MTELASELLEVEQNDLDSIAPGSALYKMFGDPVVWAYGFAPGLVNTVLIPKSARGVEQHERLINGRIPSVGVGHLVGRIVDSIDMIAGAVFGGDESEQVAHALHELHRGVRGKMPDGSAYHAWNRETWTDTWLVLVRAWMDNYSAMRGYDDDHHRLAVYRGFVELGRRFRVTGMPATLSEYDAHWEELVSSTLTTSHPARFLVEQTTPRIVKPSNMPWLPTFVWAMFTLPWRRMARMGILINLPERLDAELGIRRSWVDRVEFRVHRFFWRLIPRALSSRFGPTYFRLRRTIGTPVWRTRYSSAALEERRHSN